VKGGEEEFMFGNEGRGGGVYVGECREGGRVYVRECREGRKSVC